MATIACEGTMVRGADGRLYVVADGVCKSLPSEEHDNEIRGALKNIQSKESTLDHVSARMNIDPGDHASARMNIDPGYLPAHTQA